MRLELQLFYYRTDVLLIIHDDEDNMILTD